MPSLNRFGIVGLVWDPHQEKFLTQVCVEMFWERFTVQQFECCLTVEIYLKYEEAKGCWKRWRCIDASCFRFPLGFKSCSVTCTCKICLLIAVQFCILKNVRSPRWRLLNVWVSWVKNKKNIHYVSVQRCSSRNMNHWRVWGTFRFQISLPVIQLAFSLVFNSKINCLWCS